MGQIQTWLRDNTKSEHLAVEKKFLKVASVNTVAGYKRYLKIMLLYHQQYSLISAHYCELTGLNNHNTNLISCLEADMRFYDIPSVEHPKPIPLKEQAYSIGTGYVIEGSSLGSVILHNQLKKHHNGNAPDSYFHALEVEQPERWNIYINKLEKWVDERDKLKSSAIKAFNTLDAITSTETERFV